MQQMIKTKITRQKRQAKNIKLKEKNRLGRIGLNSFRHRQQTTNV